MLGLRILIALLLISTVASAQVKQRIGTYGLESPRMQPDSGFRVPTVQVGIRDQRAGLDTAQLWYNKVDSTLEVYTGSQWIDAGGASQAALNPLMPVSDIYRNYVVNFHDSCFVDSTLVDVLPNETHYFNKGLVVKSTETGAFINSRLQFHNYGYLVNEIFSQRLLFQILDSSTRISIGIGIKNQGIANIAAPRDMYSFIEGYVNDTSLTKIYNYQESSGPFSVSNRGILIRRGDIVEITLTQKQDSCVFYYRNLTTNNSLSLTRLIPSTLSGSSSRMGFASIFLREGHYRLMNYTISIPTDFDYVFIGNSVTWGHSVDSIKKAFVNLLRTKTSAKINNTSKSAGCIYDYLSVRDNLNFRNKTVFLSGIMSVDPVPGRTDAQIKADYQTLVTRLKVKGNKIIHLDAIYRAAFLGSGGWPQIEALNRWLDTAYGGIDTIVHFTGFDNSYLYSDLIHPNNAGHQKALEQVVAKLPWLFEKDPLYFLPGVDTIYRKPGRDSIFYTIRGGAERAIRDSVGSGGGGSTWNAITDPTGDQALIFGAGESSTWTNSNTTEDLLTVNSSTMTTSSLVSLNSTSTALAAGNNLMELVMSGANGTNAITATAQRVSVTNTNGVSGTNIGTDYTVSGAPTANYSVRANAGINFSHNGGFITGDNGFTLTASGGTGIASALMGGSGINMSAGGVSIPVSGTNIVTIVGGGVYVGSPGSPDASAVLDAASTTKGFLPPRMTATQASAIASPAEGLLVYVTNTNGTFTSKGWWGWSGAAWEKLNN